MIRAGTLLRFEVTGTSGWYPFLTIEQLRARVVAALASRVDVYTATLELQTLLDQLADLELVDWSFRGVVEIAPRGDFARVEDLGSIVAHVFYSVTGVLPTVSAPGRGQPSQPALPATATDFLRRLETDAAFAVLLVVGGVVGLAWLIGYAPNVRHLARAVPRF